MAKWFEYQVNQPNNGELAGILQRLKEIERRQIAFEQRLAFLERRPVANADQAHTPYTWGDGAGDPYYHRQDLAGTVNEAAHRLAPWVSTSVRFAESLTSVAHVKAMALQALLMAASAGGVGGLVAWRADLPVLATVGGVCVASFALTFTTLLVINRTDVHVLVRQQGSARHKRELHIQVDSLETGEGRIRSIKFLLVAGVAPEQLREWATKVLEGSDLAIKAWTGRGALFSEGQYTALMKELERAGYVEPGRGNVARSLTRPGKALLKQLTKI